jgi:RimK family alpha-L-glutamate ligase
MLHIHILAARPGWHTDELCRAIRARGHESAVHPYESVVARLGTAAGVRTALDAGERALLAADAVLARIIPNGSLEQIIFRVDALHWLEDSGVPVMNSPRAIERTVDKFYTSALLQRAGLATPETVVCERADEAMRAFHDMGDVIVKPLFGSMGLGMVRVSDEEMAWRVFRALEAIRGVYYLQRAIAHDGRDVRAFVVGDRVLGAIERHAPGEPGRRGWRTNISRGGAARAVTLPAEWQAMALCAARAVGAEYAGVDLLPADDGTVYVLEVNGIPGWRGLQEATSIDVAAAIVDHLLDVRLACR